MKRKRRRREQEAKIKVMQSQAKERPEPPEAGREEEVLLQNIRGEHDPVNILVSDFWPVELGESTFLWLKVFKFVVIFYVSPRKLIQLFLLCNKSPQT